MPCLRKDRRGTMPLLKNRSPRGRGGTFPIGEYVMQKNYRTRGSRDEHARLVIRGAW